jgi:hypothetical protein
MGTIRERTNVTVITEGIVDLAVREGPVPHTTDQLIYPNEYATLLVGTTDEGVLYYERSNVIVPYENARQQPPGTWISLGNPLPDEPVVDILTVPRPVPVPAEQQGSSDYYGDKVYVAVAGGVFRKCDHNENCIWSLMGNIPERPLCLANPELSRQHELYAGTGSGVYHYTDATNTHSSGRHFKGSATHQPSSHRSLVGRGVLHEAYRFDGRKACGNPGNGVFLVSPAAMEGARLLKTVTVEMR